MFDYHMCFVVLVCLESFYYWCRVSPQTKNKIQSPPRLLLSESQSWRVDSDLAVKFDLRQPQTKNIAFLQPYHHWNPTGGFNEWEELQYCMEN